MTSKIKVDNIENQCGGAVVTKCGGTTTISGSVVKANDIQASDGGNLISQCGATITLGASGDTINLASGASQSGFGRTGTVDWVTTIQTSTPFTAVSGKGYFINTTSGSITMNLPSSPSVGDIVSFKDYARTFGTNALTVGRGGSNMDGVANDSTFSISGATGTLIYMDSTKGWSLINDDDTRALGATFIQATGGAVTTCGNFKIHTFTGPGTFCVSSVGSPTGSTAVDYLVVAGGGAGAGKNNGGGVGGGGAGGVRIGTVCQPTPLSPAPLVAPGHTVSVQGYPIVVGAGGGCSTNRPPGCNGFAGSASSFSSFSAAGGGGGADAADGGSSGGSGGGGGEASGAAGVGNTPPVSPPQGKNGGTGNSPSIGAGGGGFTANGEDSSPSPTSPTGAGGDGINAGPIFGTANGSPGGYFGGGGGASTGNPGTPAKAGGLGGGGRGNGANGAPPGPQPGASASGTANTGGGGGAHGSTGAPNGGTNGGGSGIVIIRYKFQ